MNANRKALILLSKEAKMLVETGEYTKVNDALIGIYSELKNVSEDREDWNTFKGWKTKGYKVIKGEKGSTIWGKKRKIEIKDSTDDSEESKSMKFFPTATIFHKSQIEKIVAKKEGK